MSYIGNLPTTSAFPFDQFSGTGAQTAFTLTYAAAGSSSVIVAVSGVMQNPNTYSIIGTTLTFTGAPPSGTNNIEVLYLGLPAIGVTTPGNTAYFASSEFTATASQTIFTPSGTYTPGFVNVIRNGSQLAPTDYVATNGTTVTLNTACTIGDTVVIEVFTLTSIANALALTGGTVTGATTFNAATTFGSTASVAGNLSFNSGYGSSAVAYGCRAWVNFNGTGTVAIRASGGVSSVTDNGVGDYSINFSAAMIDANYAGVATASTEAGVADTQTLSSTTTVYRFYTRQINASVITYLDTSINSVAIFR